MFYMYVYIKHIYKYKYIYIYMYIYKHIDIHICDFSVDMQNQAAYSIHTSDLFNHNRF